MKTSLKKAVSLMLVFMMCLTIGVPAFAESNANDVKASNEIYDGVVSYVNEVYPNLILTDKNKLIDKLYKEKSQVTVLSKVHSKNNHPKIDEAYQNMMKEEKYIVNLINSREAKTTLDNWQFNLKYLKTNYDTIKKIPNVNIAYVDSYISAYEVVLTTKDMPNEKVNMCTTLSSDYDFGEAVDYAETYYSDYNSDYPNWATPPYGGDCANFILQCLYAGGKPMKGTPGSSSAAKNNSNWFSKGTALSTKNVSRTWRGASYFQKYWQKNASSYKKFTSVDSDSYDYGWTGDAISLLNSNGRAYHTLIIVDYSNPDFIIAAHSHETKNDSLKDDYAPAGGFIIYNMR